MTPGDVPEGPLLLDTDVFSFLAWQRGRYAEWSDLVDGHPFALSFATVGELRSGARNSFGPRRTAELERLMRQCVVIPATDDVTRKWAEIHAKFRDQVGQNDIWIAACALSQNPKLPLASGDRSAFDHLKKEFPIVLVHPDV